MNFDLTETQRLAVATARAVAREVVAPAARASDRAERFPADTIRALGEAGLLAVNVPEDLGGAGAGAVAYVLAMMEIAAADPGVAVTMAVSNMVGEVIARYGSPEQRRRCCHRLASAEWLAGAFGLSEPGAGSDVAAMATRAERHGDRWVLNGEKQWITSGDVAGVIVAWAKTEPERGARGVTAFLVEAGTPGLHVGRHEAKMGQRASSTVTLAFDDCAVPESAVLGGVGHGFPIAMHALDGGRCGIAAQATGTIRAALAASVAYARERHAFGRPIADFEAIRFMLADMGTEGEAARLLTLRAAALKDAGRPFTREASMAKLFASEAAQRAVSKAVQVHGGYGYVDAFPVEKLFRDARIQTIYEGTSEIQRLVVARDLLR
ncbi:MAG TPA: acyl-CoA dehydrogenase family protein [Anaeromyxobacteraceae bacterium]|nr:acyl-CoA dehydrogenase family protein [Anaeromyxobacteraceae bacterium]